MRQLCQSSVCADKACEVAMRDRVHCKFFRRVGSAGAKAGKKFPAMAKSFVRVWPCAAGGTYDWAGIFVTFFAGKK